MKTVKMTRTAGKREANTDQRVGNRTASYLVDHGYAEYTGEGAPKPVKRKPGRPRKADRVDALTTDDVFGGPRHEDS